MFPGGSFGALTITSGSYRLIDDIFYFFVNPLNSAPMVRMNALVYATCFADAARWECGKI